MESNVPLTTLEISLALAQSFDEPGALLALDRAFGRHAIRRPESRHAQQDERTRNDPDIHASGSGHAPASDMRPCSTRFRNVGPELYVQNG